MTKPSHVAIEQHAYHLWQQAGCPDGQAVDHWLRAEEALISADPQPHEGSAKPAGHPPGLFAAEESARRQREESRAPEMPRKGTTGRATPSETGKPVWPKHASS